MPRPTVYVRPELGVNLKANALHAQLAEQLAASARADLAGQLAAAREEGYSVRALADATGLSIKRVRLLLTEAAG